MSRFDFELRVTDITAQSNDAVAQFQAIDGLLQLAEQAISGYTNDQVLQSESFENVRQKLTDYHKGVGLLRLAIASHIVDYINLINDVGTEDLIGYEIEGRLHEADRAIERNENEVLRLQGILNSPASILMMLSPAIMLGYKAALQAQRHALDVSRDIYAYWEEKVEIYHEIEAATKNLHDAGDELLEQVRSGLGYIVYAANGLPSIFGSAALSAWRSDVLNAKEVVGDDILVRKFGLTQRQIDLARELGYSAQDVIDLINNFETESDVEFFKRLLGGTSYSFSSAFAINPTELSGNMPAVLADFAGRLIMLEELDDDGNNTFETFIAFNNAVLGANGYCGCASVRFKRFGERYIEMLYIGASAIAEGNGFLMAAGLGNEEIRAQYELQRSLTGLWASQAVMISEILRGFPVPLLDGGSIGSPPRLEMSVNSINFLNSRDISFNVTYRLPPHVGTIREEITTTARTQMYHTGDEVADAEMRGRLAELRQARERFVSDLIGNILVGGTVIALGIIAPPLAVFANIARIVATQDGRLVGLDTLNPTENKILTNTLKSADFLLIQQIVGAYFAWQNLEASIDRENRDVFIRWFGSGNSVNFSNVSPFITDRGVNRVDRVVHTGLYNPETIQLMNVWQNEGLGGWFNLSPANEVAIENWVDALDDQQLAADIELLLDGGFPIFGESDADGNFSFAGDRFVEAINEINRALGGGTPLITRWIELIDPNTGGINDGN